MFQLVALLLAAAEPMPAATVPLEEYERLRRQADRPSLTVVDLLRVEGSFAGKDLAMTFAGRSAGSMPTTPVLGPARLRLHSCEGEALLSRAESGAFDLTPLAPRFTVRCRVALDGSDRLEAAATRAVLEVAAAVRDGELVAASNAAGERDFSVVRAIAGPRTELPPSVAGRYQVTLLPDETRFAYRLEVRNPSRGHRRFPVTLREAEHVETVDAPVAWEVERGTYRFDLPPGESTLTFRGRLDGTSFRPPVQGGLQYLILEAHPLMRPDVKGGAKRVGLGETGLASAYRGAQAFLVEGGGSGAGAASGGEVSWTATRLEALKTAGLALDELDQVFFLGADGRARGEASFRLDNQGAPSFALPTAGEPTFASVGGEPAFLTRDAEGRLFLPLAQGRQQVVLQDVRPFQAMLGFAVARLDLPQAGVPASVARVQLRYPAEWRPLYEELAPASRLHLLEPFELVALALLLVGGERLLALGGLGRRERWLLAAAATALAALSSAALVGGLVLATGLFFALGVALLARRLTGVARALALLGAAGAGLAIAAGFLATAANLRSGEAGFGSAPLNYASKMAEEEEGVVGGVLAAPGVELRRHPAAAPPAAPDQWAGSGRSAGDAPAYQGLPARIQIPGGARQTTFRRELLSTDAPRPIFVLLVAERAVSVLTAVAFLLVLGAGLMLRRELAAGARRYGERLLDRTPA